MSDEQPDSLDDELRSLTECFEQPSGKGWRNLDNDLHALTIILRVDVSEFNRAMVEFRQCLKKIDPNPLDDELRALLGDEE